MHWLRDVDLNTKFFHMSASVKRKFQRINMLKKGDGVEVREQEGMCNIAKSYFEELFASREGQYDPVLNLIQPRITTEENESLIVPITKGGIQEALKYMHPEKSQGLDGFNPTFYQKNWHICGDDIFEVVTFWLDRGFFPPSINDTNVCLIPKCSKPNNMKDHRPISLCNVVYKLVSKVLANRMKKLLPKLCRRSNRLLLKVILFCTML